jgi:hypothetical protein
LSVKNQVLKKQEKASSSVKGNQYLVAGIKKVVNFFHDTYILILDTINLKHFLKK